MERLAIKGTWKDVSDRLKKRFSILTDADLLYIQGKEEQLLDRLVRRLGQTKGRIREMLESI
jgi:uncharacterized protein YjbJ (UPF0337 family)